MPRPYVTPPVRHEFFGIVHQLLAPDLAASAIHKVDSIQVDGQSDFLIYAQSALWTDGQAKVLFQIQSDKLTIDTPMFIANIGPGWAPFILAAPFRIPRSSAFNMIADDRQLVAAQNTIRVLHAGLKEFDRPFEPARAYQSVLPFTYVANFTADDGGAGTIAANGTKQWASVVSGEYDFDIYKITASADGDCTLQVETSGKALTWFNRPCHLSLIGGAGFNAAIPPGAFPFRLPRPVHVPASGAIVTVCTDL